MSLHAKQIMRSFGPGMILRANVRTFAASSPTSASTALKPWGTPAFDIRVLYDSDCPLCMREIDFLRGKDAGKGKISFVDIADPAYDPAENQGISYEQGMERIHGIRRDGTVVKDVEVFRYLYEAVGLGWVYAATKNERVLQAANAVYGVWAKYRTQLTGRPPMEQVLLQRKMTCRDAKAEGGSCEL